MAIIHNFDVHAGDFGEGMAWYGSLAGTFNLPAKDKMLAREKVAKDQVSGLEIATEENVKNAGGALGWGILGGAMAGPVGLLAGLLMGGKSKKKVVFIIRFKDGRKLLASSDSSTYMAIQAATF
jgi:hypothetical protein